jgi:integrase
MPSLPFEAAAMKPLCARTAAQYDRILTRAYGRTAAPFGVSLAPLTHWPKSQLALLRAAVMRRCREVGADSATPCSLIPRGAWTAKRPVHYFDEAETTRYEAAAKQLAPTHRALVQLLTSLALRARELLELPRAAVEGAVSTHLLTFIRKGGEPGTVDVAHVLPLLQLMLDAPAAMGKKVTSGHARAWKRVGEILSPGSFGTQYQLLRRKAVCKAGELCGLKARPHLLRHACATRMEVEDGAPHGAVQALLGHKSGRTTDLYIHRAPSTNVKWMRKPLS